MKLTFILPSLQGRCINFTRVKEESAAAARVAPRTPIHTPSPPPPDYGPVTTSPPPTAPSPPARSPPSGQAPPGPPPSRLPPGLPCAPPSRPPPGLRPWIERTNKKENLPPPPPKKFAPALMSQTDRSDKGGGPRCYEQYFQSQSCFVPLLVWETVKSNCHFSLSN